MPVTVTIRVPDDLFELMNQRRFDEKTTFQEVGLSLFRHWVEKGTAGTRPNEVVPLDTEREISYTFSPIRRRLEQAQEAIAEALKITSGVNDASVAADAPQAPGGESGKTGSITERLDAVEVAAKELEEDRARDSGRTKRTPKKGNRGG